MSASIELPPLGVVATNTLVEVAVQVLRTEVHWLSLSPGAHVLEVGGDGSSLHGCMECGIFLLAFPQQIFTERAGQLIL